MNHRQRILDLINRRQGPPARGPQGQDRNMQRNNGGAEAAAEPAAPNPEANENLNLLEAQAEMLRVQIQGGQGTPAMERALQRADAAIARNRAEINRIQRERQEQEAEAMRPRHEVLVPAEPHDEEGRRRMHINPTDLTSMFFRKSSPIQERLDTLMQYAETNRLTHRWIRWSIPYALTEEELFQFEMLKDRELQEIIDFLIKMFRPKNKDKSYYESLIQSFVRPQGESLKSCMFRFATICRRAVAHVNPAYRDGLLHRYAESALFHLTSADTRRALKKYMKEKELANQRYTTLEITELATNLEEVEGWIPPTTLSMSEANIKAVFVSQKTSRPSSPEILREKRRSREDSRRREERLSSRDRNRNLGGDDFDKLDRPIKTRADTPLPEKSSFQRESRDDRREQPREPRYRSGSRGRESRGSYGDERRRSYSRGRSTERRSFEEKPRRFSSSSDRRQEGNNDSYEYRPRQGSQNRYRSRSGSPVNEFLSANIKQLFIGADFGRYELTVRCKRCRRDIDYCKCRKQ